MGSWERVSFPETAEQDLHDEYEVLGGLPVRLGQGESVTRQVKELLASGPAGLALNPRGAAAVVTERVKGQDDAVLRLLSFIAGAVRCAMQLVSGELTRADLPSNYNAALIIGSSGSGKTHTLRVICEVLKTHFFVINGASITRNGWSGGNLDDELLPVAACLEDDPEGFAVIFVDEVDKMASHGNTAASDPGSSSASEDFLKLMDGGIYAGRANKGEKQFNLDTDRCIFVFAGAFTGVEKSVRRRLAKPTRAFGFNAPLEERVEYTEQELRAKVTLFDLEDWGFYRELGGRISQFIAMEELSQEVLVSIIKDGPHSMEKSYAHMLQENVRFGITESAAELIAAKASKQHFGARGVSSMIQDVVSAVRVLPFEKGKQYKVIVDDQNGKLERDIYCTGDGEADIPSLPWQEKLDSLHEEYSGLRAEGRLMEAEVALTSCLRGDELDFSAFVADGDLYAEQLALTVIPPARRDGDPLTLAVALDLLACSFSLVLRTADSWEMNMGGIARAIMDMGPDEESSMVWDKRYSLFNVRAKEHAFGKVYDCVTDTLVDVEGAPVAHGVDALFFKRWTDLWFQADAAELLSAIRLLKGVLYDVAFNACERGALSQRLRNLHIKHGIVQGFGWEVLVATKMAAARAGHSVTIEQGCLDL